MSLAAFRREFVNHSLDFQIISHYSLFDHFRRSTMNRSVPLAEAKATLSDCIREVEGGKSVLITRHGKPVAALVHPKDLDNLERLKKAGPEGGLASLAGGWEGSDELARLLDESARIGQRDVAGFE
jgi:prevent-host-death family protein